MGRALDPMSGFGSNSSTNLKKIINHDLPLQQIEFGTEMPNDKLSKRVPGTVPQNSRRPPVSALQNGETATMIWGIHQLTFHHQFAELENKLEDWNFFVFSTRIQMTIGYS